MPTAGGPNTLGESNLVFAYDTGDVSNSYIGEPTVNKAGGVHLGFSGDRWAKRTDYPQKGALPFKLLGDVYQLTNGNNYWGSAGDFSPAYNKTYTLSYWYYLSTDSNLSQWHNSFFGTPQAGGSEYTTVSTKSNDTISVTGTNTWRYGSVNITTSTPVNSYSYFRGTYTSGGGDNMPTGQIYIANFQLEEKSHATPFTTGTRSATQGLLPVIGNSILDLTNMSFDSSAKMVFDGTDDYIELATNIQSGFTQASYEFICTPTSLPGGSSYRQLYIQENSTWMALYNYGGVTFFGIDLNNGSGWFDNNGGYNTGARTTATITANTTYHVFYSWNGTSVSIYLNGNLQSTTSTLQASNGRQNVTTLGAGTTPRNIGSRGSGTFWTGNIDIVKFYNRALTAQEVRQNYQQYKTRFNLS